MIEINLLPGARKAKRSKGGASLDVRALLAGATSQVRDPFLLSAVAAVVVAVGAVGWLYTSQASRENALRERETKEVQDSTRYAAVIAERQAVEAQRDSVVTQIRIIQAIDGTRYIWAHVLDEVSRAMPPYTWLKTLQQSSPNPPISAEEELGALEGDSASLPGIYLIGNTVDIQALTRFMRLLEASPFLEGVSLARSELVLDGNRQVTEFRLDLRVSRPDSAAIRVAPFKLQVR